jgi:hopene-associated glycosyltransferase HpnB
LPTLSTILAATSAAIWLYLAFFRGQFWRLNSFDDDHQKLTLPQTLPTVHAIIPARNEAPTIAATVTSLLHQNYPGKFSITVVDDHSQDHTAEIATQAAFSSTGTLAGPEERRACAPSSATFGQSTAAADILASAPAPKFSTVSASPLQPGWTGKLWALNQAVTQSPESPTPPDYFWFTDADITHAPDTLQRLVSRAEKNNLALTSLMVELKSETYAEKFLIPPFLYFFLQLYPPNWITNPKSRTAGAAGGCILIRAESLKKIGGLSAIRRAVIDDCALATAVKRSGGQLWMGITRQSHSLRNYATLAEIRDMIARTAFTQLNYSTPILLATLAALFITYIAPIAFLFVPNPAARPLSAVATFLMLATFFPTTRFYRQSPFWILTLPAAALFYAYATTLSAIRYWLGRGAQWKGRSQAPTQTS